MFKSKRWIPTHCCFRKIHQTLVIPLEGNLQRKKEGREVCHSNKACLNWMCSDGPRVSSILPWLLQLFTIWGNSLVLHCASLLRTIFASSARAHGRVHVQNVRDFPQTKLDSEIDSPFLLNEYVDPRFSFQVFAKNSLIKNIFEEEKKFDGRA